MKESQILTYAGLGLGALVAIKLFGNKSGTSVINPGTTGGNISYNSNGTFTNAPAPPASFNAAYYNSYQYPAMVRANPEIQNSNHTLSQSEAAQYKQNYLELQQWLPTVVPSSRFPGGELEALNWHWHNYGVAQKYSFMPFSPPKWDNYIPAPTNSNSSGGGSWLTDAFHIATGIIALLGTDERLNDKEVELLVTGSYIPLNILPFYDNVSAGRSEQITGRMQDLISQYLD